MKRKQLKPNTVRRWLTNLSPRSYFRAGYCDACPIARFLGRGVAVDGVVAIYRHDDRERHDDRVPLPEWARSFVTLIDGTYGYGGRVSRDAALDALLKVAYRRA